MSNNIQYINPEGLPKNTACFFIAALAHPDFLVETNAIAFISEA